MNATEATANFNDRGSMSGHRSARLNGNYLLLKEDEKYEVLKELRIKLGKTKKEFHKIFELYNRLTNQK